MFGTHRLGPLWELTLHPHRPWMNFVLPVYTLVMVLFHYQPHLLVPFLDDAFTTEILWLVVWVIIGALGGLLALSALFLAFSLAYSPFYLVGHAGRILDPQAWVDQREVRFYVGCFVILCGLLALAFFKPEAGLMSFILLAGFAQVLWHFLV